MPPVCRIAGLQRCLALLPSARPLQFCQAAVTAAINVVGADSAALQICTPEGTMRYRAWRGLSPEFRAATDGHYPWRRDRFDRLPVVVPDVSMNADVAPLLLPLTAEGITALAFIPLLARRHLVGGLTLYYTTAHQLEPDELAAAQILADGVVMALEQGQAGERLRRAQQKRRRSDAAQRDAIRRAEESNARLATLAEFTASLSVASSMDEVADAVLSTAAAQVGARSSCLCLLEGQDLRLAYSLGYPTEVLGFWDRFPLDGDLPASEAVRTGTAVFVRNLDERDRRYPTLTSAPVIDDDALAVIPLVVSPLGSGKPIGCLVLGFEHPRDFTAEDTDFLYLLTNRCAGAITRARLNEEREQALRAAETAQEELSFLAGASAALGETLRLDEVVDRVAGLAVPQLADGCALYLDKPESTETVELFAGEALNGGIRVAVAPFGLRRGGGLAGGTRVIKGLGPVGGVRRRAQVGGRPCGAGGFRWRV